MADAPFLIVEALYPGLPNSTSPAPHTIFSRIPGRADDRRLRAGRRDRERRRPRLRRHDAARRNRALRPAVRPRRHRGDRRHQRPRLHGASSSGSRRARSYLTSVCTGSLVLGAAGLLKGKRAACHWAWRDMLPLFGAIPDEARVARDGNIITGGGVTAGIDFALVIAAELAGERLAQALQLGIEYAPAPPFDSGRPETAPPEVLAMVQARNAQALGSRREGAIAAAARF